jgi:acyl-[acyl-carrier-protein]-phospholipid O-acyltransferase / long-chain-fatty-acid--[acyl-carrier-protein] ligase
VYIAVHHLFSLQLNCLVNLLITSNVAIAKCGIAGAIVMGMKSGNGYNALFRDGGFQSFLWTQFLAAFNDNLYKMIVSVGAVELAANQLLGSRYLALAGAVFVLPFLLFAGYAGQLAASFSKTRVLQVTKAVEIIIMGFGMIALSMRSIGMLLIVLFLLALQANFFSPAKYGILPEMLSEAQLTRANGMLEFTTFAAIVLGTSVGSFLFARWKAEPLIMGGMLLGIAVVGSITSLFIPEVPACGSRLPMRWNPFAEIRAGIQRIYDDRPIWLTVAGMSYFWFLGALFQMTVILIGSESLHLSATRTGLLVTALALGIGVGSIAAGWLSGDQVEIGLVPYGAALLGLSSVLLGYAQTFSSTLIWLTVAGFAGGLFIVPLNAFLQEHAEPEEKGRLLATNNFLNMIGVVLASATLYLFHDILGWTPSHILAALGGLTLAATTYIAWQVPAPLVRLIVWSFAKLFFKIRIVGADNIPKKGGALIVSNHVSYADAVLIGCATSRFIRFLMWQPLYDSKWLHPFSRLFDAIPIPTRSPKESLRALRNARTELEKGMLVCIFPEGEITRTSHVKPFERGVDVITHGLESTPVLPIYLDGLWGHALSLKGGRPFASRLKLRHEVTVHIGEAMTANIGAEHLYERVLELGTQAADSHKNANSTLSHRFVKAAKKHWSSVAVADSTTKTLTFGETLTAALLLRKWILGNCSDSRCIGLLLPASVGGALANLGVTLAGKTAVNLNFTAGEEALAQANEKCGISTILSSRTFLEKASLPELPGTVFIEDLLAAFTATSKALTMAAARLLPTRLLTGATQPHDLAAVIFSSGSTGTPKGVMLSHWNLISNVDATAQVYSVGHTDCMLGVLPFFHSFGYTYTLWFPLLNGFKSVFHANPTDAKVIGELAATHHATLFLSTPTFCLAYLRKCTREQFASIRYLLVGAEKLRPALAKSFQEKFGVTLLEGYGCTEMGPVVSVNAISRERSAYKPETAGRPLPNVSLRIVDPETLDALPAGEAGLLLVNGPSRMIGYFGDPERTAQSLMDGFYNTGDIAFVDSDGFLKIVDRLARFSKIAGEMVPHLKIEEAIHQILGDQLCIVIGIPDEQRGERLALLYTQPDITPGLLWQRLSETGLPRLWIPKRENMYLVDTIPTLGTGKLDLRGAKSKAIELADASRLDAEMEKVNAN